MKIVVNICIYDVLYKDQLFSLTIRYQPKADLEAKRLFPPSLTLTDSSLVFARVNIPTYFGIDVERSLPTRLSSVQPAIMPSSVTITALRSPSEYILRICRRIFSIV